jgi:DNA-binding response OmpR family regulator
MGSSVLIVEDEELIASSLARALQSQGYEATTATTVADALATIEAQLPDLVLLDLGLPDGDGTDVASHMARRHASVPVIALTARSDEIDIVLGLEAGAVDYVIKPFHLAELLARVRAHLRFADTISTPSTVTRHLVVGDITIDRSARRTHIDGSEVSLRPKEFDLLVRLATDAGIVVSREQLIDDVWDDNWWGSTRTLDVHINSVRRKLGERPGEASRITTVRGVGYRLESARR